jgi:release factor glutamine methyltransferase
VARQNAAELGFGSRIRFLLGDGFEPVRGECFDLVASNPPYLAGCEAPALAPELACEPREALFAGAEGTEMLRRIARGAWDLLEEGGILAVEVTPQQAPEMTEWLVGAGFARAESHCDLAGRTRVVSAERGSGEVRLEAERGRVPAERGQSNDPPS